MTSAPVAAGAPYVARRRPLRLSRVGLHAFLITTALVWLAPVAWAVFTSFRPLGFVVSRFSFQGQYCTDNNLISAAAVLVALPTLIVFAALQRQFINGLTLGATKE